MRLCANNKAFFKVHVRFVSNTLMCYFESVLLFPYFTTTRLNKLLT